MIVRAKGGVNQHKYDDFDHQGISAGRNYLVIGIEADYYRIVDDRGEPLLYPKYLFETVDSTVPDDWVRWEPEPGEVYAGPRDFADSGFWERFHDHDVEAIARFRRYVACNALP